MSKFLSISCLIPVLAIVMSFPAIGAQVPEGGNFTLTSHHGDGAKISLQDYRGKVVLLTFGYTHCPDICPMTLTRLQQVIKLLERRHDEIQALFVTFDPERDTPEHLKTYMAHFGPKFMGLTGAEADIAKVSRQYGVSYRKQESKSAAGYLFAHTDYVFVIDRQGDLRRRYNQDYSPKRIARDIQRLLSTTAPSDMTN